MKPLSICPLGAFIIFLCLALQGICRANVGVIYLKNNAPGSASVWVNGYYQGHALSGATSYIPSDGFVTNDSGFQADGTLKLEHAFGGWPAPEKLDVLIITTTEDNGKEKITFWRGSFSNEGEDLRLWIGGKPELTALEVESAGKFQKSMEPTELLRKVTDTGGNSTPEPALSGGSAGSNGSDLPAARLAGPVLITSPAPSSTTSGRIVAVSGRVTGNVNAIILANNGRELLVPVSNGTFSAQLSLTVGKNTITARPRGSEVISSQVVVTSEAEPTELWVELVWDGPGDMDLHVFQPSGTEVSYKNKRPSGGGELDIDNTSGYGPEHYYISRAKGDRVFSGKYPIVIQYYDGSGSITCRVTVFQNEKYLGSYSQTLRRKGDQWSVVTPEL